MPFSENLLSNNIKIEKMQQQKMPETWTMVDFLFEKANILSKRPASKICSHVKEHYNLLRQTMVGVHYAQCQVWFSEGL